MTYLGPVMIFRTVALAFAFLAAACSPQAGTLTATPATLQVVAQAARPGDVVRVSKGAIGPLSGIKIAAPGITIVAEPGASIESSAWVSFQNISGITFRGFTVRTAGGLMIKDCSRVYFEQIDFAGPGAVNDGNIGLAFRNCTNVGVKASRFHDSGYGMSVHTVRGIAIVGNDFRDSWGDAIGGLFLGDVLIERNTFTNFRGPPLHLDAIQLIAADNTKPIDNVTIRNNTYLRGSGTPAQFIFAADSDKGFTHVAITGNAAWGGSWWCVGLKAASDSLVADNYCQGTTALWDGQVIVPWIRTDLPGVNLVVRNNLQPAPADTPAAMNAWLHRNADSRDVKVSALTEDLEAARARAARVDDEVRALTVEREALAAQIAATKAALSEATKAP